MGETDYVVRLRGLPWSSNAEEIVQFLDDCKTSEESVHIMRLFDGRSTGEAYVELTSEEDVNKALAKNKKHLGKRYVDVHKAKRSDLDFALKRTNQSLPKQQKNVPIVKLRGLPFSCSKEEVANFFSGLEIAPNGITFITDQLGRCTGEGYVQFMLEESIERALLKHKQTIAHRYIEVFQCTIDDLSAALSRASKYQSFPYGSYNNFNAPMMGNGPFFMRGGFSSGGGRGSFYQHQSYQNNKPNRFQKDYQSNNNNMNPLHQNNGYGPNQGYNFRGRGGGYNRGNFYQMSNGGNQYGYFNNQSNFRGGGKRPFIGGYKFKPTYHESLTGHSVFMKGLPFAATDKDIAEFFEPLNLVDVKIHMNHSGRPSGNATADFQSHDDALEAMKRNKNILDKRYIELLLRSTPDGTHSQPIGYGTDKNFK